VISSNHRVPSQFYGQASRAFIKLEALDGATAAELDKYQVCSRRAINNTPFINVPVHHCQARVGLITHRSYFVWSYQNFFYI
jgi:hypothetical protein